jgi:hypothetical protein
MDTSCLYIQIKKTPGPPGIQQGVHQGYIQPLTREYEFDLYKILRAHPPPPPTPKEKEKDGAPPPPKGA